MPRPALPKKQEQPSAASIGPSNQLFAALPAGERARLLAACTKVNLVFGAVLYERGDRIRFVYFPTTSFISLVHTVDEHSSLEVGMIGAEGMCGHALILGGKVALLRALVQGGGRAWRMDAATFHRHLKNAPALRRLLGLYVNVLVAQLAQTAACTRFHVVEKRLARWLLMTQDRAHSDVFQVTQEFLSFMLGVRRVGVTAAAGVLQARKVIRYKRGSMTILNRRELKASACACYRSDLNIYNRELRTAHL
jgi:CRP-like cAMP-binding protein